MTEDPESAAPTRRAPEMGDEAAPAERVRTGVDGVDAVIAAVEELEDRPIEEHVGVFEQAHEQLRRALDGRRPTPPEPAVPPRRLRLDAELVRRGLARSREHASELIAARRVKVSGALATKPATGVTTDVAHRGGRRPRPPGLRVPRRAQARRRAGRRSSPPGLRGPRAPLPGRGRLDRRLHRRAAARAAPAQVVAVDVGYGQLAWTLQQDERVAVHDRTNVRELDRRDRSAGRSTWWSATCPSSPWSSCSTP